jgi:dienelactone hydrolase
MRAARVAAALLAIAGMLAGCSTASGPAGARFVVGPPSGIADPVSIALVGLAPGEDVVVSARADTAAGPWTSHAVFAVPVSGVVTLATARPLLAPYVRPDAGGLLWSLDGPSLSQAQLERTWAAGAVRIHLFATQSGKPVAQTTLVRLGLGQQTTAQTVFAGDEARWSGAVGAAGAAGPASDTAIGRYLSPSPPSQPTRPAVVVIDGDDGGASGAFLGGELAAEGFPVFLLPAFGPAGQIPGSAAMTVESFDAAVTWLAREPAVDEKRIFVFGSGSAAPLALWFAVNRPAEVYGAIVASGATALQCASDAGAPVLLEHGEPVACEEPVRPPSDTALLPLDRIPGPLLLACGTRDDVVADACAWQAGAELVRGPMLADVVLRAVGAGHAISVPPLIPVGLAGSGPAEAQATEDARAAFWARLLGLLRDASRS